jgi:hypothetical protein
MRVRRGLLRCLKRLGLERMLIRGNIRGVNIGKAPRGRDSTTRHTTHNLAITANIIETTTMPSSETGMIMNNRQGTECAAIDPWPTDAADQYPTPYFPSQPRHPHGPAPSTHPPRHRYTHDGKVWYKDQIEYESLFERLKSRFSSQM